MTFCVPYAHAVAAHTVLDYWAKRVPCLPDALGCHLQWRTQFRKDMNRSEAQANNRAIDSLINYETVKYCGNEEHEVARYDECMHKYQVRSHL